MQEKLFGEVKNVSLVERLGDVDQLEIQIDFDVIKMFGKLDEVMEFVGKNVWYTVRPDIVNGLTSTVIANIAEIRVVDVVPTIENIKLIPMTTKRSVCNFSIKDCRFGEFYPGCIALLTGTKVGSSRKTQWVDCTCIDQESKEFELRIFTKNNLENAIETISGWLGSYVRFDMKVTQYGNQTDDIGLIQDKVTTSPEVEVARKIMMNEIKNDTGLATYEKAFNLMSVLKDVIDGEPGYMLVRMASEIYLINAMSSISNDFDIKSMKRAVYCSRGYLLPSKKQWSRPLLNTNKALRVEELKNDEELMSILDALSVGEISPTKSMYLRIRKIVDDTIKLRKGVLNETKELAGLNDIIDSFSGLL